MTPSIPTSLFPPTFSLFRPPSFLFPALSSFHPPPSPYPSCPPSLPPCHAPRHFILTLVPQREGREREGREKEGERESRERQGKQGQENTYFLPLCWPKPLTNFLPPPSAFYFCLESRGKRKMWETFFFIPWKRFFSFGSSPFALSPLTFSSF